MRLTPTAEQAAAAEAVLNPEQEILPHIRALPSSTSVPALQRAALLARFPTEAIAEIADLSKQERVDLVNDLKTRGVYQQGDRPAEPQDDFTVKLVNEVNRKRASRGRSPAYVRSAPKTMISAEALQRIRATRRA